MAIARGFRQCLLEAMGRGLPVIATDVVGVSELVRDGENGILIRPDDPAALAEAIGRLRRDPELAERLAREGRRTFERERAPELASRELLDWLAECAGR